ncbi:hypothetical protein Sta7437_3621 [Stanieria cyanosphaera PCC 7437]|uniref:Phycobilisome protein n=1 Tax=Stanieria cyanosphaera (strain ATCC 29371 / PCC 7437) TaxID=111780 RepID=K9XYL5_STAC7|nr:hypothetical protein [Stanieria cyanosphaera]AFZ37119.1 hypothetical protein Sta7437_3621 [Stanieria cyanosphaera PCC 7437]
MHSDLQAFWYQAEDHYLQSEEIKAFKHHTDSLAQRLKTYKSIRDREIDIFQTVANQLLDVFPDQQEQLIEKALKHWLLVMRNCSMAMLLNNPEFLQRRLLEWLAPQIKAHQLQEIETKLYEFLQTSLQQFLSQEQFDLIEPFLLMAQTKLLGERTPIEIGG